MAFRNAFLTELSGSRARIYTKSFINPLLTPYVDLEHLTKSQVVLLALLVAIVSSAATGIVTVSLLGQAPPQVAANVGNIIERTVQQVVFATSTATTLPTTKTTSPSVTPTPATAIDSVQRSIIRIVVQGDAAEKLVARGIIVGRDGAALTDAASIDASDSYVAILWDGSRATIQTHATATSSALESITLVASSSAFTPASIADPKQLQLGMPIIKIGGVGNTSVSEGIIATLPDALQPKIVFTDVSSQTPGSVIIDGSGSVIGMTTTNSLTLGATAYTLLTRN